MRITIRFNLSIAIDIDFGFETPLFSSMYWFHIQKVYFDTDGTVEYAEMLFNLIKHPKYWNMKKPNIPTFFKDEGYGMSEDEYNSYNDEAN